jgi:hypothetical protein
MQTFSCFMDLINQQNLHIYTFYRVKSQRYVTETGVWWGALMPVGAHH